MFPFILSYDRKVFNVSSNAEMSNPKPEYCVILYKIKLETNPRFWYYSTVIYHNNS